MYSRMYTQSNVWIVPQNIWRLQYYVICSCHRQAALTQRQDTFWMERYIMGEKNISQNIPETKTRQSAHSAVYSKYFKLCLFKYLFYCSAQSDKQITKTLISAIYSWGIYVGNLMISSFSGEILQAQIPHPAIDVSHKVASVSSGTSSVHHILNWCPQEWHFLYSHLAFHQFLTVFQRQYKKVHLYSHLYYPRSQCILPWDLNTVSEIDIFYHVYFFCPVPIYCSVQLHSSCRKHNQKRIWIALLSVLISNLPSFLRY